MIGVDFLKKLLFPPRCVGCREIFDVFADESKDAFCQKCRSEWEMAKLSVCKKCKRENIDCICDTKWVKAKDARILSLVKFGSNGSVDGLIYFLKHHRNDRVLGFASNELYKRLAHEEKLMSEDFSSAIFTNVPRSDKAISEYGFDHAKLLAMEVAKRMGGEYRELLGRKPGGRPQKGLDADKRRQNVSGRFYFESEDQLDGRRVVLIDDVLTTGATASECIKVLKDNGCRDIILLAIAKAQSKKIKRKSNN